MLLKRPHQGAIETINDLNCFVANFWRAIHTDPKAVARYADWPVNEADLHARHMWLVRSDAANAKLAKVRSDPEFFDAKIAGWWCWGACCWIGSGWCEDSRLERDAGTRPDLHGVGSGISRQLPDISGDGSSGRGVHAPSGFVKLPHMDATGRGIHGQHEKRPAIATDGSAGVHSGGVNGNDELGTCARRRQWLTGWFERLAGRLRHVRVCCGHWARVCDSDSTLIRLGTTGVFLDPPYAVDIARMLEWYAFLIGKGPKPGNRRGQHSRTAHLYANDLTQDVDYLVAEVAVWCLKWGSNPDIRIAVCGLEGEYPMLDAAGWEKVAWKSRGGYGNRTQKGKDNAARERIWFNAACLRESPNLFTVENS